MNAVSLQQHVHVWGVKNIILIQGGVFGKIVGSLEKLASINYLYTTTLHGLNNTTLNTI